MLVFLRHVFPITARHIAELFLGVHALLDADGLEIGAPELLEYHVVLAEDISIHLAIR